jgi:hypothetical protein
MSKTDSPQGLPVVPDLRHVVDVQLLMADAALALHPVLTSLPGWEKVLVHNISTSSLFYSAGIFD